MDTRGRGRDFVCDPPEEMKITVEENKVIKIDPCCPKMVEHYGTSFRKFFDKADKIFLANNRDSIDEIYWCPFCGTLINFIHGTKDIED